MAADRPRALEIGDLRARLDAPLMDMAHAAHLFAMPSPNQWLSRSCGEEVCNVLIFARLSRAVHPSPGFTRTPLLIQLPLARLAGVRVFSFLVSPEVSSENIYHPRKGRGEVESCSLETTALT